MTFQSFSSRRATVLSTLALLFLLQGCCDPRILTETLPDGHVGTPYAFAMVSACGYGHWWVDGDLPPGLSFTSDGLFIGTPQFAGLYFLMVTWEERYEGDIISAVSKGFTLMVHEADSPEVAPPDVADRL